MVWTLGLITTPGSLAFAMMLSEYQCIHTHLLIVWFTDTSRSLRSIIKRAGVVPMSIGGIFKEVTTITVSAWVFGDGSALNILSVRTTFIGASKGTATYYPIHCS
jgi:solute carrier family 35 protein C2